MRGLILQINPEELLLTPHGEIMIILFMKRFRILTCHNLENNHE